MRILTNYLNTHIVLGFLYVLSVVSSDEILPELQSHSSWKLLDRGEDCGHSSSDRIIGGSVARLGQYPWIARLGYSYEDPGSVEETKIQYGCGGTIISDRYVLTAAHCGPDVMNRPLVKVRLGEHNTASDPDCQNGVCAPPVQDIDIKEIKCHENYHNKNFQNDICLLRLATPIQFNRYVYPICLPAYAYFLPNRFNETIMEVAGWGITNTETEETSDVLLTLQVPLADHSSCVSKYKEVVEITDMQMCAGGVIGKDSCRGDSGGPLMSSVSLDAPPRYFIVGIVSFGLRECADSDYPGVYTNVFQYMPWILDNVRK